MGVTRPETVRVRNEKWDGALFCRALTTEGCEIITQDHSTTVTKAISVSTSEQISMRIYFLAALEEGRGELNH